MLSNMDASGYLFSRVSLRHSSLAPSIVCTHIGTRPVARENEVSGVRYHAYTSSLSSDDEGRPVGLASGRVLPFRELFHLV